MQRHLVYGVVASAALALGSSAQAVETVIFSETFDSAASSANFTSTFFTPSDVYVEYGFDYSAMGASRLTAPIGSPAGGGSESGLLVAANLTGVAADAGVNFFPVGLAGGQFGNGYYTLTFDVFAGVNGGGGTTEFIMAGAHHSGTEVSIDAGAIDDRDGNWFEHTTEGGITSDFITFTARGGTQVAEDFLRNSFGSPELPTALPSPPYAVEGAPGELWTTYKVVATPNSTSFFINDSFVADLLDTDYTVGLPMFGYSDIFGSVAGGDSALVSDTNSSFDPFNASFAIFDNIVVTTVPEPTTALLAVLGLAGVARRNRR